MEMRKLACLLALTSLPMASVLAQSSQQPPAPSKSAPRLVREANDLLRSDKAAEALKAYGEAQQLRPDAREIAFDQGLAHYRLGEFDQAREAFNRASTGVSDALADDAVYGLGAIDHAQALAASDPKEAISHVENAMRNYQTVLGSHPDHAAARQANLKAASYWRQLKQQLEQQQQQQQQQDQQNQDENEEQQEEQQQQEQQSQQNQEQQQQQSQSQQDQEEKQKQEQQQQQVGQEEQKEQKEQQARAEEEDDSQDQAERKLREMVQAMRDRKKHRKEDTKPPSFRPAEKDW